MRLGPLNARSVVQLLMEIKEELKALRELLEKKDGKQVLKAKKGNRRSS